jgi:hypothetical protein
MSGWAFIDSTQNSEHDSIFVSLSSASKSYMVPVTIAPRDDLNGAFNKQNITNSGFKILAFTDSVQRGSYNVGLVIKDAEGRKVKQTLGIEMTVKEPLYSSPVKISGLPDTGRIVYDMVLNDEPTELSAGGWAALENHGADGSHISVILKNDQATYLVSAKPSLRPDVTASFKNKYKLDSSGYRIRLQKSELLKGKYTLGLLIEDSNKIKTCILTEKETIIP